MHALAEIVPKSIVHASGIILALAGQEIFQDERVPSHIEGYIHANTNMYSVLCMCTSLRTFVHN